MRMSADVTSNQRFRKPGVYRQGHRNARWRVVPGDADTLDTALCANADEGRNLLGSRLLPLDLRLVSESADFDLGDFRHSTHRPILTVGVGRLVCNPKHLVGHLQLN